MTFCIQYRSPQYEHDTSGRPDLTIDDCRRETVQNKRFQAVSSGVRREWATCIRRHDSGCHLEYASLIALTARILHHNDRTMKAHMCSIHHPRDPYPSLMVSSFVYTIESSFL